MIDRIKRYWRIAVKFAKYLHGQQREHPNLFIFAIIGLVILRIWWGSWILAFLPHLMIISARYTHWLIGYARQINESGGDMPSLSYSIKVWWFQTQRRNDAVSRWASGCLGHGVTPTGTVTQTITGRFKGKPSKITPKLMDLKVNLDGDVSAIIAPGRINVPVAKVVAAAPDLAESIGCREIIIQRTEDNGCAELTMFWSDPFARTIPIKNIPRPRKLGDIVIGVLRNGQAAVLSWLAGAAWIVGTTGAGKSNIIMNAIADVTERGIPHKIAVSDPKGGMVMRWLRNSPNCVAFAKNAQETATLVNDMVIEMRRRQELIDGEETVPTEDLPLMIIILDELMTVMPMLTARQTGANANQPPPIMQLLNESRAALMWPIVASQAGHAGLIGEMRNLLNQRVLLRAPSAAAVGTVIADGLTRGVRAHLLHPMEHRGVGWVEDERGHLQQFRAGLVSKKDVRRLGEGLPPKGMNAQSRSGNPIKVKDTYLYHAKSYDKIGPDGERIPFDQNIYKGITNNTKRRFEQHRLKDWAFCKEHGQWENWWVEHVDESKMIIEGPFTREEALRREKDAILATSPVWNEVHNWDNPVAQVWGKVSNRFPTRTTTQASPETTDVGLGIISEPSNADLDREAAAMIESETVTVSNLDSFQLVPPTEPPDPQRPRRVPLPPIAPLMILAMCALVSAAIGIGA